MGNDRALVPAEVVEQSVEQAINGEVSTPIQEMLEGKESAYQKCLELAMKATKSRDWADMGGNPYLQGTGSDKVAFRFGLSIRIDRDPNGRPIFDREDFEDEHGKAAIYTVSGTGQIGSRTCEAIGSASTRDQFLGWIGKGEDRKAKPFYEVVEDVKKKAVTNLKNNIIKTFIGLGGQSWEDLAQYGIYKEGKTSVTYGKKTTTQSAGTQSKSDKPPYWVWGDKNDMLSASLGKHFSDVFLKGIGMKPGNNPKIFTCKYSESAFKALESQYTLVEVGAPTPEEESQAPKEEW